MSHTNIDNRSMATSGVQWLDDEKVGPFIGLSCLSHKPDRVFPLIKLNKRSVHGESWKRQCLSGHCSFPPQASRAIPGAFGNQNLNLGQSLGVGFREASLKLYLLSSRATLRVQVHNTNLPFCRNGYNRDIQLENTYCPDRRGKTPIRVATLQEEEREQ